MSRREFYYSKFINIRLWITKLKFIIISLLWPSGHDTFQIQTFKTYIIHLPMYAIRIFSLLQYVGHNFSRVSLLVLSILGDVFGIWIRTHNLITTNTHRFIHKCSLQTHYILLTLSSCLEESLFWLLFQ